MINKAVLRKTPLFPAHLIAGRDELFQLICGVALRIEVQKGNSSLKHQLSYDLLKFIFYESETIKCLL